MIRFEVQRSFTVFWTIQTKSAGWQPLGWGASVSFDQHTSQVLYYNHCPQIGNLLLKFYQWFQQSSQIYFKVEEWCDLNLNIAVWNT